VHPGVRYLYKQVHETYMGGTIEGIEPSFHYNFENLWDSPEKLRLLITSLDTWSPGDSRSRKGRLKSMIMEFAASRSSTVDGIIPEYTLVRTRMPGGVEVGARKGFPIPIP
jgi:ATP sulfurylase